MQNVKLAQIFLLWSYKIIVGGRSVFSKSLYILGIFGNDLIDENGNVHAFDYLKKRILRPRWFF